MKTCPEFTYKKKKTCPNNNGQAIMVLFCLLVYP